MSRQAILQCECLVFVCCAMWTARAADVQAAEFGFARVDITPRIPLRLSGYGSRTEVAEGIDERLYARAMAVRHKDEIGALVSVDTIGFPSTLTKAIHAEVRRRHAVPRSRFVVCCTHSHTSPQIDGILDNIFAVPLTEQQREETESYTNFVRNSIVQVVDAAVDNLEPGRMLYGQGAVDFAQNRRVLTNGRWTGFGIQADGPVDHSLGLLRVTDSSGSKTRGLIFNYACHCTTFGGQHNQVNGDWAGYAAKYLEEEISGCTALCTIGCGADANPRRGEATQIGSSQANARLILKEVRSLLRGRLREINAPPFGKFRFRRTSRRPTDARSTERTAQERASADSATRREPAGGRRTDGKDPGVLPDADSGLALRRRTEHGLSGR